MTGRQLEALDRWITGNGEDRFASRDFDEVDAGEQSPEDAAEMERLANLDADLLPWWEVAVVPAT